MCKKKVWYYMHIRILKYFLKRALQDEEFVDILYFVCMLML